MTRCGASFLDAADEPVRCTYVEGHKGMHYDRGFTWMDQQSKGGTRMSIEKMERDLEEYFRLRLETCHMTLIKTEDLQKLREDHEFLCALEDAGVDNWEGYGEALRSLNDDE